MIVVEAYRAQADLTQCYNCQQFGHVWANCKEPPRCLWCGGGHLRKECPRRPTTNRGQIAAIVRWGLKRSRTLLTAGAADSRRRRCSGGNHRKHQPSQQLAGYFTRTKMHLSSPSPQLCAITGSKSSSSPHHSRMHFQQNG
jgi:hypothetical protein